MERRENYKGHAIELRPQKDQEPREEAEDSEGQIELLIDDEPVRHGQLPDGSYFLHEYAYDWTDDLVDLARRFVDHQDRAASARRSGSGR